MGLNQGSVKKLLRMTKSRIQVNVNCDSINKILAIHCKKENIPSVTGG